MVYRAEGSSFIENPSKMLEQGDQYTLSKYTLQLLNK